MSYLLDDTEPAQLQLEFKCWLINSATGDRIPVSDTCTTVSHLVINYMASVADRCSPFFENDAKQKSRASVSENSS